jgi:hypothetical protein
LHIHAIGFQRKAVFLKNHCNRLHFLKICLYSSHEELFRTIATIAFSGQNCYMKQLKRFLHSPRLCFIATIPSTGIYFFPSWQPAYAKASAGVPAVAPAKAGKAVPSIFFTHLNKLVNC